MSILYELKDQIQNQKNTMKKSFIAIKKDQ